MHPSVATVTAILVPFAFLLAGPAAAGGQESAVRREGDRWILSTATVERVVALEDGRFLLREAENMGFPGVELTWRPGSDDNWLSHYEVLRDGEVIDVVAKGTFAFDHSAGADPAAGYEIRTVDGAGNVSGKVRAGGPAGGRRRVIDDAPGGGIRFTGEWRHATGAGSVHAGTISVSGEKGAAAEATFEGAGVSWFSKFGPDGGKASVSLDGGPAESVDTYSADEIRDVCIWRKGGLAPGRHAIRIVVLGEGYPRSAGTAVSVDAIRIDP